MIPAAALAAPRRGAMTEVERRRNRMTSNRLSAQRSRMKRQQREDELTAVASQLVLENEAMRAAASAELQRCRVLEQENRVLMAHGRELYSTLQLRNSQLRVLGDAAGLPLDLPEIPGHLRQLYAGGGLLPMPPQFPNIFLQAADVMDDAASMPMEYHNVVPTHLGQ